MTTPHKHEKLIKKWADGHPIQQWDEQDGIWMDDFNPQWFLNALYRIKPEPQPDIVRFARATFRLYNTGIGADGSDNEKQTRTYWSISKKFGDNLKAIFDGDTGEFKSVERV